MHLMQVDELLAMATATFIPPRVFSATIMICSAFCATLSYSVNMKFDPLYPPFSGYFYHAIKLNFKFYFVHGTFNFC